MDCMPKQYLKRHYTQNAYIFCSYYRCYCCVLVVVCVGEGSFVVVSGGGGDIGGGSGSFVIILKDNDVIKVCWRQE